ncbi:unnamed protein product [Linum trigynum]|uniref:Uncharacterized protein n=1 Tax=Linum trigynum TaxID=586398 RepID=A0AAV2FPX1_9ROSI
MKIAALEPKIVATNLEASSANSAKKEAEEKERVSPQLMDHDRPTASRLKAKTAAATDRDRDLHTTLP